MANKYGAQAPYNWSANWCDPDDGVQDVVKPAIGDVAILTANSAAATLDENSAALGGLTLTGFADTLAFGTNTIDVDGNAIVVGELTTGAGGTLEVSGDLTVAATAVIPDALIVTLNGTGDVDAAASAGDVRVNTAGTHTAISALTCAAFTLTAGTYDDGGLDHDVAGDISLGGGALTSTGRWTQTASGLVRNYSAAREPAKLVLGPAGGTSTVAATVYCKSFGHGAGAVVESGSRWLLIRSAGDDFWEEAAGAGPVTLNQIQIGYSASDNRANTDPITATVGTIFGVQAGGNKTFTFNGAVAITGLVGVWGPAAGQFGGMTCAAGVAFSATELQIGIAAAQNKNGHVTFAGSGVVRIGSGGIHAGDAASLDNTLELASRYVELGGDFDCDADDDGTEDITVTADAGMVHVQGVGAPTVSECHPDEVVYFHDCTDNGDNGANAKFDTHASPAAGMLLNLAA